MRALAKSEIPLSVVAPLVKPAPINTLLPYTEIRPAIFKLAFKLTSDAIPGLPIVNPPRLDRLLIVRPSIEPAEDPLHVKASVVELDVVDLNESPSGTKLRTPVVFTVISLTVFVVVLVLLNASSFTANVTFPEPALIVRGPV